MKKAVILAISILTFIGMGFTKPPQAQAWSSLNPVCWIADQNNPAVKNNCKGHDWSWPHWGGGSNQDGLNRACSRNTIVGQAYSLNAAQINMLHYTGGVAYSGMAYPKLVMINAVHYDRKFRPDYIVYTWESHFTYVVNYNQGYGAFSKTYSNYSGEPYSVTCNMKGKIK